MDTSENRSTYLHLISDWEDLNHLSLSRLRSISKELGIPSASLRKESLIQALKAHQSMDWKALKDILPNTARGRRMCSMKKRLSKEPIKEDVFKDLPLLTEIQIPELFTDNPKRVSSMPDVTSIRSVRLIKRAPSPSDEEQTAAPDTDPPSGRLSAALRTLGLSMPSRLTQHRVEPDYYMPLKLHAYQYRRAETYVTYSALDPIPSIGGDWPPPLMNNHYSEDFQTLFHEAA